VLRSNGEDPSLVWDMGPLAGRIQNAPFTNEISYSITSKSNSLCSVSTYIYSLHFCLSITVESTLHLKP
jgi:hypothetical protein